MISNRIRRQLDQRGNLCDIYEFGLFVHSYLSRGCHKSLAEAVNKTKSLQGAVELETKLIPTYLLPKQSLRRDLCLAVGYKMLLLKRSKKSESFS